MRTTVQEQKDQLLLDLLAARQNIFALVATLAPEQLDVVFLGTWSVKDLLAHLVGWDFTNIQAVQDILTNQLPQFYAHYDRDWQSYNAHLVAEYGKEDVAELMASVADSHRQLINFLETVPAEEFNRDRGLRFHGLKITIARLLRAEAEDEQTHYNQIQRWAAQHSLTPE